MPESSDPPLPPEALRRLHFHWLAEVSLFNAAQVSSAPAEEAAATKPAATPAPTASPKPPLHHMKLEGGEGLVLKALLELQEDSGSYVEDARLAAASKMFVEDVRDWLETLEGKGCVERTRLTDGVSAYVTGKGKQALRDWLEPYVTGKGIQAPKPTKPPLREDNEPSTPKGVRDLIELLKTPEVWDKVVTFREVFRSARTQIALVTEFKTLHDKLQDLQIGCRPVALLRRGVGSGKPDWENLDVEGQNLLGLLDDLVKAARGVSFAAKESLWVVKLESAGRLFDQAVTGRDKAELDRACGIIDETVVKRLSAINRSLIDAVRVLNLPSLVDCLSEVRGKLEGIPLDKAASGQREGFTKGLEKLAEMSERLAAQVARHDEFQSIEDVLTSVHGAIREDFDSFLIFWEPVYETILSTGGNAWPESLRAAADVLNAAVGDRNLYKTEKSFQKFLGQLSRQFKNADTDLLQMCKQLQDLGKELATLLEMMSDV